jgi:hypothetical protein
MVHFTLHLIAWVFCAIFWFLIAARIVYGIYLYFKDKKDMWFVYKHELDAKKREDDKKREEVSKDIDTGLSLEEYKLMRMTPEERAEYEKTQAKIKKDKKIAIIALSILGAMRLLSMILTM